jgi:hypothetical protein
MDIHRPTATTTTAAGGGGGGGGGGGDGGVVVAVVEVEESCLKVYPETLCCAGELPTARESQFYEPAASTG